MLSDADITNVNTMRDGGVVATLNPSKLFSCIKKKSSVKSETKEKRHEENKVLKGYKVSFDSDRFARKGFGATSLVHLKRKVSTHFKVKFRNKALKL